MARRLAQNVERLVRVEKYASAAIIVLRLGREIRGPLASMRVRLRELASTSSDDESAVAIAQLDRDLHQIEGCLDRLEQIQHPEEWGVAS